MKNYRKELRSLFVIWVVTSLVRGVIGETIYVDSINGSDTYSGTEEKPIRTIDKAATIINLSKEPGPTTIKIAPGIYNITKCVVFNNTRSYTKKDLHKKPFILPNGLFEIPLNVSSDADLYTNGYNHIEILRIYKKEITNDSILVTHLTPYYYSNPFYENLLKFLKSNKFGLLKDLLKD